MESQMDEVLKLFVERLGEPEKPGTVFPHREYKPKGNTYNREKRIQDAIERQKQSRFDWLAKARKLAGYGGASDKTDSEKDDAMLTEPTKQPKPDRQQNIYANQLMIPDAFTEIPTDFSGNYYCVPFPTGLRCMVIASQGTTTSRRQNGSIIETFQSPLPGGNKNSIGSSKSPAFCLLDCIFVEHQLTYYVLDMMCWSGYQYFDCEAEFRFQWKAVKFQEDEVWDLQRTWKSSPYKFALLPFYETDPKSLLQMTRDTLPFKPEGVLFYNKLGHYALGEQTPLVCGLSMQYFYTALGDYLKQATTM